MGRLFGQEINGELASSGMYKANNCFYVYGFKDQKTFKVIKYDANLKVLKEYEKQLPEEVSKKFWFL